MTEHPILSFGVMTDNHLDPAHPELAERTLAGFRLFRKLGADLLIDCGDITDFWQPEELKHFHKMFTDIFPERKPQTLWLLAGHDVLRHPDYFGAYPEGMKWIDMEDTVPVRSVNGISFVGLFQCADYTEFEKRLDQAVRQSGGKPVFAVTHEPAYQTVLNSEYNGDKDLFEIFRKYPAVIHISGHTHTPIGHDRNIWQGDFTAFNAGSLTYWKDITFGRESRRHQSCDALYGQLYTDRLEVRRFNVINGKEIAPPWVIPLPFQPETAPYTPQRRREELPTAEFQSAEPLHFSGKGPGILTIENAEPFSSIQRYRTTLFDGERELAVLDFYPGTWPANVRDTEEDFYFPPCMLESGRTYRCRVAALNHFDRSGKAAEFSFTVPEMGFKKLPAEGISRILAGDEEIPVAPDGSFEIDAAYLHGYRITLPEELVAFYGEPVVMVFDFECEHAGRPAVIMACGERPDFGRHFFPSGKEKSHRHCFDLTDLKGDFRYLLLCEGEAGRYCIKNVQYFTYPEQK